MSKPRILAIDLGRKRIGLAVTDELGVTVRGLPTLERKSARADFSVLRSVIHKHNVTEIVIGRPLHMSGESSIQTEETEAFADDLRRRTKLPVHLIDERLTSWQAEQELRVAGPIERKGEIDQRAAEIILETYLQSLDAKETGGL